MNFLTKLIFLIKRPKIIIISGAGAGCAVEAVFQVLKNNNFFVKRVAQAKGFSAWFGLNNVLILELKTERISELKFLVQKAKKTILLATAAGEIPADDYFFASEKEQVEQVSALAKALPVQSRLIVNFDDETVREIKERSRAPVFTFGFQKGADFLASDVNISQKGTNFKINYQGNIVPVWLKGLFGKEQIYSALAGVCAAMSLDVNLVSASQALNSYQSLPGKMRLIKAVKSSYVLDDSKNASPQSMAEALQILGKIPAKRRIAVLADILTIGKYAIAAHQAIGERAAKHCDLLFTVGPRAKFIAQGAEEAEFSRGNIFCFDRVEDAAKALEQKIEPGDLVLVDGSKQMKMSKIVEEIKSWG